MALIRYNSYRRLTPTEREKTSTARPNWLTLYDQRRAAQRNATQPIKAPSWGDTYQNAEMQRRNTTVAQAKERNSFYQTEYGNQNRYYLQQWAQNPLAVNERLAKFAAERKNPRLVMAKRWPGGMGGLRAFEATQQNAQQTNPNMVTWYPGLYEDLGYTDFPIQAQTPTTYINWGPGGYQQYLAEQAQAANAGGYPDYGGGGGWGGGGYNGGGYSGGGGSYTPAEPSVDKWLYGLINWRV